MRETYSPVILRKRALLRQLENSEEAKPVIASNESFRSALAKSMYRPFLMLIYEPMCLCLCIYTAILIGTLYLFFGAFPLIFSHVYGFNLWQVGLTFLGQLVGTMMGALLDPFWRWNLKRLVKNHQSTKNEEFLPEFRLPPAILGAPMITIGLFWFGWTSTATVRRSNYCLNGVVYVPLRYQHYLTLHPPDRFIG